MMNASESLGDLAAALAGAQAEMTNAQFNQTNPHYRSKYADLAAIRDATIPLLAKHQLAIVQSTGVDENGNMALFTRIIHASGQWVESVYPIPTILEKPQAMGSAVTYARRYSWAAMCAIAAEADDDANAAEQAGVPQKSAYRARKDGDWDDLKREMMANTTTLALKDWGAANAARIRKLPTNWQEHFREAYEARMAELKAANGGDKPQFADPMHAAGFEAQAPSTLREQLDASLKATDTDVATYADRIEDWVSRLKAADPSAQGEIWETEIAPFDEDGKLFPPDRDRLRRLLVDAA